jgi:cell division protein ZapA
MSAKSPPPPSAERAVSLDIALLGREYKVACKDSERAELLDAVALLDRRMRDIRDAGKIVGTDRIAVMAALNLAHELLRERRAPRADQGQPTNAAAIDDGAARRRIVSMQSAIDETLAGHEELP